MEFYFYISTFGGQDPGIAWPLGSSEHRPYFPLKSHELGILWACLLALWSSKSPALHKWPINNLHLTFWASPTISSNFYPKFSVNLLERAENHMLRSITMASPFHNTNILISMKMRYLSQSPSRIEGIVTPILKETWPDTATLFPSLYNFSHFSSVYSVLEQRSTVIKSTVISRVGKEAHACRTTGSYYCLKV